MKCLVKRYSGFAPAIGIVLVFGLSLGLGALIRSRIPIGQGVWIVQPVMYVVHVHTAELSLVSVLITGAVVICGFAVVVGSLPRLAGRRLVALELMAALLIGGALANTSEAIAFGTVTDFLGIRGARGIYSAGDVAIALAASLFPVVAWDVAKTSHKRLVPFVVGATAYIVVALLGLSSPERFPITVLVTIVSLLAAIIAASRTTKREEPRTPDNIESFRG